MDKLSLSGYIIDGREVIGTFGFSFHDCTFSWEAGGQTHHFYKEKELKEEATRHGWKLVDGSQVKITRTYIGR